MLCKALATPRTTFVKIMRTFLHNSCLYVINILIKCHVQMLALKKLQIPPRFNTYLVLNKFTTGRMFTN